MMRPSPGKWQLTLWLILFGVLISACQPVFNRQPTETALSSTLPPPAQTRTLRSAPTPTATAAPSPTATQLSSLLEVSASDLDGITIKFWHTAAGEAETLLQQLTAEFNQSNTWGITVEPVGYAGSGVLDEQVRLAIEENQLPGLIAAYTDQALLWEIKGAELADLTPYVSDPLWGLSQPDQQDFYHVFWAHDLVRRSTGSKTTTLRLGVPWYRSALVLIYNRTWAEELGFRTYPDTPAQFRRQVCAAAQANLSDQDPQNDGTGGWLIRNDPLLLLGWIQAFGGELEGEDGTGLSFHTPAAEEAVQYLANLTQDGCAWLASEELPAEAFANRRALVWTSSLANLRLQQTALQQANNNDEWVVLPFPASTGSQTIVAYGPALIVPRSDLAQELGAWLFARWLLSAEKQAQWAETNGVFPVRSAALQQVRANAGQAAQWEQALVWLPKARSEPAQPSWRAVRGVMADALQQILMPGFQENQAASLLIQLDQIVNEIEAQIR
ncbi:MAG: extracellular solute-binding protein [Anaerolineales bacterium]|jgi:ABC-type glycerol-3-phosphate transport system substrate-binding protein|nr:extracellular solute-binding protein [Anaerolineales bacterium]